MCIAVEGQGKSISELSQNVNGMNTDQGQHIPWAPHCFSEFKTDTPQQLETTDKDTNLNPDGIHTNPQTCFCQLWCRTQTLLMKNRQCISEQLVGRFSEQQQVVLKANRFLVRARKFNWLYMSTNGFSFAVLPPIPRNTLFKQVSQDDFSFLKHTVYLVNSWWNDHSTFTIFLSQTFVIRLRQFSVSFSKSNNSETNQ